MLFFFFFNDTATTEIYTLSLHDALPIFYTHGYGLVMASASRITPEGQPVFYIQDAPARVNTPGLRLDRKSTRLNSSHANISYAVFCLKKKKKIKHSRTFCYIPS